MAFVLLVVSDIQHRDAWRAALEGQHGVIVAPTGERAIEQLRGGGVDVLVLDHEVEDGVGGVLAGLEDLDDAPPLVLIAGDSTAPALSARVGVAAFLLKPCHPVELAAVVGNIVPRA
jgi:DNA-binding NtrC family response regulator